MTASEVIAKAKAQVGYHEGRNASGWDNAEKYAAQVPGLAWANGQPWCATFVSWCALEGGSADLFPRTASCAVGVNWFRSQGRLSEYPAIGAQVFYGSGGGSHTGVVYAYDETYVYTVEGNTNTNGSAEGDGVYEKKRARRDAYVYGYGYPKYVAGITTADPSKSGKAGYHYEAKASAPAGETASKPATPATPKPAAKPTVDLSNLVAAAKADPHASQGHTSHPADVKPVEEALKAEGLLAAHYASDGSFGSLTVTAYSQWQERCGYHGQDANGIPGKATLVKLGSTHGFSVKD